jgi:hypothetical protein
MLFANACQLKNLDEQKAYVAKACGDDATLLHYILRLLEARAKDPHFLENPPSALSAAEFPPDESGRRIGRYRLIKQIGEGGWGEVYGAEQEEPMRRRVALKLIKLGRESRQVIARFEADRQALALMDHPNIANVLDAGADEKGRPYFVMELVEGDTPITDYCDKNSLSTAKRLELFSQVCQAVQHAHQK